MVLQRYYCSSTVTGAGTLVKLFWMRTVRVHTPVCHFQYVLSLTLNIYVHVHCSICIVAFLWLSSLTCHLHVSILCGESSTHISSQDAWSGELKELFCVYTILARHIIALHINKTCMQ